MGLGGSGPSVSKNGSAVAGWMTAITLIGIGWGEAILLSTPRHKLDSFTRDVVQPEVDSIRDVLRFEKIVNEQSQELLAVRGQLGLLPSARPAALGTAGLASANRSPQTRAQQLIGKTLHQSPRR